MTIKAIEKVSVGRVSRVPIPMSIPNYQVTC